jgi:uncharacterized RDD family membrane protein YckC
MNSPNPSLEASIFGTIELQGAEIIDQHLNIAGIGARSHAFLIDWHIRLLLALAWLAVIGFSLFSLQEMRDLLWDEISKFILFIWLAPAAVIYFFYHPLLEIFMAGRTPGKRMAGIRIVTLQGITPSASALLIRNVFRLLDCLPGFYILGIATVALTRQQVRIGDLAAGLVLVYDNKISHEQVQKVAKLATTSSLDPKDQTLLLDLLARWKQLDLEMKIMLGEKFLSHINKPLLTENTHKKNHSKKLHHRLEDLSGFKND